MNSGKAFVVLDRLLDNARTGPVYLKQPPIADMVVDAIYYNARTLRHYKLHAFTVMANHVHLLMTPNIALPKLMKSLKGITAKRGNQILGISGSPFWQGESYDRLVRNEKEFDRIEHYIEQNPVTAGLVKESADFRWSSVGEKPT